MTFPEFPSSLISLLLPDLVSRSLTLATCYVGLEETGQDRIRIQVVDSQKDSLATTINPSPTTDVSGASPLW